MPNGNPGKRGFTKAKPGRNAAVIAFAEAQDPKMSDAKIGEAFGLTRQRVWRIRQKASPKGGQKNGKC